MVPNKEECEALLKRRILVLSGEIQKELIDSLKWSLLTLSSQCKDEITLYIDSSGGNIYVGALLCDAIRICGVQVKGIVVGRCMSAAIPILQSCHQRVATKGSRFLIHRGKWKISIPGGTETEMKEAGNREVERVIKAWNDYVSLLAERTGKTFAGVVQKKREEKEMSADEALAFGLIDMVI